MEHMSCIQLLLLLLLLLGPVTQLRSCEDLTSRITDLCQCDGPQADRTPGAAALLAPLPVEETRRVSGAARAAPPRAASEDRLRHGGGRGERTFGLHVRALRGPPLRAPRGSMCPGETARNEHGARAARLMLLSGLDPEHKVPSCEENTGTTREHTGTTSVSGTLLLSQVRMVRSGHSGGFIRLSAAGGGAESKCPWLCLLPHTLRSTLQYSALQFSALYCSVLRR